MSTPVPSWRDGARYRWMPILILLCVICAAVGAWWATAPTDQGTVRLVQAAFILSDSDTPPVEDAPGWKSQELPDNWRLSRPGVQGTGWYRADFEHAAGSGDWGVFIPLAKTTFEVWVNGMMVRDLDGPGDINRRQGNRPHFSVIPSSLLHDGSTNRIYIRLRVAPNLRGGLTELWLGPSAQIETRFERDYFLRVTLTRSLNTCLLFVGLLSLLLASRAPVQHRSVHLLFALLAILWSLRNFHYTVPMNGLPTRLWEWWVMASLWLVMGLLCLLVCRLVSPGGKPMPQRMWWALTLGPAAAALLLNAQQLSAVRLPWYLASGALGLYATAVLAIYLARNGRRRGQVGAGLLMTALLVTIGLGFTDLAVTTGLLPFGPAARLALGPPLIVMAITWWLAERYFRTIDAVGRGRELVMRHLQRRTRSLALNHERLRAVERELWLTQERDRLMRDLHDGVGSQLIIAQHALSTNRLSSEAAAQLLGSCLDDLRLVVDSLEPESLALDMALARLRFRLMERMANQKIQLRWHQDAQLPALDASTILQLLRVILEGVTNALKHAQGADAVDVRIAFESASRLLSIEIHDNGQPSRDGFIQAAVLSNGRGLKNLATRAAHLGAQCTAGPLAEGGWLLKVVLSVAADKETTDTDPVSRTQ